MFNCAFLFGKKVFVISNLIEFGALNCRSVGIQVDLMSRNFNTCKCGLALVLLNIALNIKNLLFGTQNRKTSFDHFLVAPSISSKLSWLVLKYAH